jgi:heat shock protein HslJ
MKRFAMYLLVMTLLSVSCQKKIHNQQSPPMSALTTFDNTRWKLVKIPGIDSLPVLRKDVYIQFNKSDSTFHGHAGCNNMTGRYAIDGNSLIIGPAAMTRMMCPEDIMKVENLVAKAINATNNYLIKGERLELRKENEVLAEFEALYLK